jgi:hypothetical protein
VRRSRQYELGQRQIRALGLTGPTDLTTLCAKLAEQRDRPIHLLEMPSGATGLSGMWVPAQSADYIFYDRHATGVHRNHIILHEIAHLVFGHAGGAEFSAAAARLLTPNIDVAVARRILGRSYYTDEDERAAETLATLLLSRITVRPVPTRSPPEAPAEVAAVLNRLRTMFGADADHVDG